LDTLTDLVFPTKASQISLLEEVLNAGENAAETQDHYMRLNNGKHIHRPEGAQPRTGNNAGNVVPAAQRFVAPLEHLSGGQNLSYQERNKSVKWVTVVFVLNRANVRK
jgi:DNA excision repair protein ERCC-3